MLGAATATYRVQYSEDDYSLSPATDDHPPTFYINPLRLPESTDNQVAASFSYSSKINTDTAKFSRLIDGFYNTACQTDWAAQPLLGMPYFTVELGSLKDIDAIDITAGFYYPAEASGGGRKFDFSDTFSVLASDDGENYRYICSELTKFTLGSGETLQVDKSSFGENYQASHLRLIIEEAGKIEYGSGRWAVSIVEFAVWENLELIGEAKLLGREDGGYCTVVGDVLTDTTKSWATSEQVGRYVVDKVGNVFLVTSSTPTTITLDGEPFAGQYAIFTRKSVNNEVYDVNGLLDKAGDKLHKITEVNKYLTTQEKVDDRAELILREDIKNHTKATISLFDGDFNIGQTVELTDPWTKNINDVENVFIEAISFSDRGGELTVGKYN